MSRCRQGWAASRRRGGRLLTRRSGGVGLRPCPGVTGQAAPHASIWTIQAQLASWLRHCSARQWPHLLPPVLGVVVGKLGQAAQAGVDVQAAVQGGHVHAV